MTVRAAQIEKETKEKEAQRKKRPDEGEERPTEEHRHAERGRKGHTVGKERHPQRDRDMHGERERERGEWGGEGS